MPTIAEFQILMLTFMRIWLCFLFGFFGLTVFLDLMEKPLGFLLDCFGNTTLKFLGLALLQSEDST